MSFSFRTTKAYWAALGEFISAFSWTETLLFEVLVHESGVSRDTARAVFSGARIDTMKDFINRLREARGEDRDPHLTRALEQLGMITRARNDIVHYGIQTEIDGSLIVSNERVAHIERSLRRYPMSVTILGDMRRDLAFIDMMLMQHMKWGYLTPTELEELRNVPWLYKPHAPSQTEKKPPRTPQGSKRRSPPSRE